MASDRTAPPAASSGVLAATSITAGTATTAVNALSITQTWNAAQTFTAVKVNVTDTSSNSGSLLADLQVGGTSKFSVTKAGALTIVGPFSTSGTSITGGNFNAPAGGYLWFTSRGFLYPTADGVFKFSNSADTDFSRLQFGGTTSSFPSLKRSSTTLAIRLADDSADAPLTASNITASGYIKPPSFTVATVPNAATAGAGAQIYVTDESGGACGAQSNNTNWKRLGTQTTIS